MSARLTVAHGFAHAWRRVPVRGGGRILGPLALGRPGRQTSAPWAGGTLAVDFRNPPEASVWVWGTYEPDVTTALQRLITPGSVCIDIGANSGVHTLLMRGRTGAGGAVLAVDPSPAAIERVTTQASQNGWTNISTAQLGLGARASTEEFHVATIGIGALPTTDREFSGTEAVHVEIVRLDDLLTERDLIPDVIKIDTDGGEVDILQGASETLAKHRPALVLERCPDGLQRRGHSVEELDALLADAGYELWAPVFVPRPNVAVGPGRVGGFRPVVSLAGLDDVDNVVAVDPVRHQGWSGRSVPTVAPAAAGR